VGNATRLPVVKSYITRDMGTDIEHRGLFNEQAQLYQKYRPHYPEALFDTLAAQAHLTPGSRLIEIGPGTGQATIPMAQRSYKIIAVELGKELADATQQELSGFGNVQVINESFEDVELPDNAFDLIYAATAFHWVKPEVKYAKPHRLLRSTGHLAVIQTCHVSDGHGDHFFYASQPIYDKYLPPKEENAQSLPTIEDLKPTADLDTKLFQLVHFGCFPVVIDYSSTQYTNLLRTYSPQLSMEPTKREAFMDEIKELINTKFGGKLTKRYAMSLTVAKKM